MNETEVLDRIAAFLDRIGIPMKYAGITGECFVAGIQLQQGTIVVDREQLKWPGDILHEAGHVAVMEAEHRELASGDLRLKDTIRDGEELGAIAWSYAAALEAGIPPEWVFHEGGYRGDGDWLLEQYQGGTFLFLPILQWMGLCVIKPSFEGEAVYPKMKKWLR
jgi:hypothetical protein